MFWTVHFRDLLVTFVQGPTFSTPLDVFFCNYVCKCVKTDSHSEGPAVLKIGHNQASTLLGCLGEPMATKMRSKDGKMMFSLAGAT